MALEVYGIPTCDTCRKALKWLTDQQIPHQFVNHREHPPTLAMTQNWVQALTSKPLRNTSGQAYRALGDDKASWTEGQWAAAFAQEPMLLKRPVFVKDGQAVLTGFKVSEEEKIGLLKC